ncbi:gluconolactonase [Mesorhizobium sp. J18]|uniref:SMP-30/gluconolactonase/LRE family protein n=1 Tax=Mesorhizobium sp. J18 TaxID=935263 RepID=UPI00119BDC84|nr:SMP-30/gluconolactonase/LRE family protein [Mesorhizobium sp. J18]TWG94246.1 gluconolactonase [Mesorhizobium sp. J18]
MKTICDGLRFPEGPVYLPDGSILLVEIEAARLTKILPNGEKAVVVQLGGGPNGAAIGPDGHCYICNNGGFNWHEDSYGLRPAGQAADYSGGRIERINLQTGTVEALYTETAKGKLRGPNDLVFDRDGGFWFTDAGKARERDLDRGGVYYAKCDGSSIVEVIYPMLSPNGIGLSPNEDQLYVAETQTGRIWAFDLDGPGQIFRQPWPSPHGGRLLYTSPNFRLLDSLAIDSHGYICVATIMEGGILVVSPCGEFVAHVPLPDRFVTNLCFGGKDGRIAYVTASQSGKLFQLEWPRAGHRLNFNART